MNATGKAPASGTTGEWLLRLGPVLSLVACVMHAAPGTAAPATDTFGPGTVSCQILDAGQEDCLLSTSRITADNKNEASFSLAALPPGERASFQKWCLNPDDECIVTIQGQRESPLTTRLATVSSLQWRRPRAPTNQAAATP